MQGGNNQPPGAPVAHEYQIKIAQGHLNTIGAISTVTGIDANEVLNNVLKLGIMVSEVFRLSGIFADGLHRTIRPMAAPPPEQPAADPDDVDERTPEERLAALRKEAEQKSAPGHSEDAQPEKPEPPPEDVPS